MHLKLTYAVCEKVCVPTDANLEINLIGTGTEAATIAKVVASVPRRVTLGAGAGLRIRSVRRNETNRIAVDVTAPNDMPVDLFVEGPTPDWSLTPAEIVSTEPGVRRFSFRLDDLPPGAQTRGAALTLTAVSPDNAVEVVAHID